MFWKLRGLLDYGRGTFLLRKEHCAEAILCDCVVCGLFTHTEPKSVAVGPGSCRRHSEEPRAGRGHVPRALAPCKSGWHSGQVEVFLNFKTEPSAIRKACAHQGRLLFKNHLSHQTENSLHFRGYPARLPLLLWAHVQSWIPIYRVSRLAYCEWYRQFWRYHFLLWHNNPAFGCAIIYLKFFYFLVFSRVFTVGVRSGLVWPTSFQSSFQSDCKWVWIGKSLGDGLNCVYLIWKSSLRVPNKNGSVDPVCRLGNMILFLF